MSAIFVNIVKDNKGMALLLAVTIVSLLVALTVEFNRNMRNELISSANLKEGSQLSAVIKSGYTFAAAALMQDKKDNTFDTFHDRWAKLGESNFSQLFANSELKLTVSDLSGRLQLNSLAAAPGAATGAAALATANREILRRLLESENFGDLSEEEVSLIVDAITDWVDKDDQENGIEETEKSYYQSLDPSYSSKDGPFEHIEELLLVRGITWKLFSGDGGSKGLRDLVTAHGNDGKININTAPAEILQAMSADMTEALAGQMVDFRQDEDNQNLLSNTGWYQSISGWPGDVQFAAAIVSITSSYFVVTANAHYNEREKTLQTVVQRDSSGQITMISRKVE